MRHWIWLAVGGWFIGMAPMSLALDEVTYEAAVDKPKIIQGDQVQYLVKVNYSPSTMPPTITPPSFDQFTVLNDYQTTQQKESEDTYLILRHIWLLSPREPGHLSIAAAIITYQDPTTNLLKNGRTKVQFVDVSQAPAASPAPVAAASAPTASGHGRAAGAWAAALAVAAGLGCAGGWLLLRRSSPARSPVPAEGEAARDLAGTVAHLEREDVEGYIGALTRVMEGYLQKKFGWEVNALSTAELLARIRQAGFDNRLVQRVEAFFATLGKVKFAGYAPAENELLSLHQTVERLIDAGRGIKRKRL